MTEKLILPPWEKLDKFIAHFGELPMQRAYHLLFFPDTQNIDTEAMSSFDFIFTYTDHGEMAVYPSRFINPAGLPTIRHEYGTVVLPKIHAELKRRDAKLSQQDRVHSREYIESNHDLEPIFLSCHFVGYANTDLSVSLMTIVLVAKYYPADAASAVIEQFFK